MFQTPVALIIFNRPAKTAQVVAELRALRPARLFVIADGPRPGHPTDADQCAAARAVVDDVAWSGEVVRNYAATNMGCGRRIASGLDWLLDQVDEAIIVEDDCLPDASFFPFCHDLLARYRDNERVMTITGTNPLTLWRAEAQSYHFSRYGMQWGWATWRLAWRRYDFNMTALAEPDINQRLLARIGDEAALGLWRERFELVQQGRMNTWDFQWTLGQLLNDGLAIVPATNLVSNIGFDGAGTHTRSHLALGANVPRHPLAWPLRHPAEVAADLTYDTQYNQWLLGHPPAWATLARAEAYLADGRAVRAVMLLEALERADLLATDAERTQIETLKAQAHARLTL